MSELNLDELKKALDLLPPKIEMPFNAVWCSATALNKFKNMAEVQEIESIGITSLVGVPVVLRSYIPDNQLWLMNESKKFGEMPLIYKIVDLGE